ncbi:hypothetical protein FHG87_009743 [Trinorchestia longiramus]|nr:hypothetical protein FHG87_009743 [Trinorchestia longiramus]
MFLLFSTRCGLTGEDLNRRWRLPSAALHPSIYHTKALLEYITRVLGPTHQGTSEQATSDCPLGNHGQETSTALSVSAAGFLSPAGGAWSAAEDHSPLRPLPSSTDLHHLQESRGAEGRYEAGRTSSKLQHELEDAQCQLQEKHQQSQLEEKHQLQRGVVVYCDYHGHSRQKNLFLYGCSRQLSWWPEDGGQPDHPHLTRLPALCHDVMSCFSSPHCCYTIERSRESTARVAVWRQYDVACSYTLEASASGCDQGVYEGYHLGTHQLVEAGAQFCEALHQLLCPAPAALPHQLHLADAALHHASSSEEESNGSGCESELQSAEHLRDSGPRKRSLELLRKSKTSHTTTDQVSFHFDPPTQTQKIGASSTSAAEATWSVTSSSTEHSATLPPPGKRGGSVKPKSGRVKKAYVGKKKSSRNDPLSTSKEAFVVSTPKHLSVGPSCTATRKLARSMKRESDSEAELDRDLYCCNESDG